MVDESKLQQAGEQAQRAGIMWWNNPHPSGSMEAHQWDIGHTKARKEKGRRRNGV